MERSLLILFRSTLAERSQLKVLLDIALAVKFLAGAGARHVADVAEDGTFEPGAIELANDRPCDARVAIRVAAIEEVFVVEADGNLVSLRRGRRPLENFLCPVHAQVVVHPAEVEHLRLSGVPKLVVCFGALKLFF